MARQTPTLLNQNLFMASKHPHNSLSSCYSSPFVQSSSSDILMPGSTGSSPSAKFERVWFRLSFPNIFKSALLSNFNIMVKREILIIVFQHLEIIYSFVLKNCCVFFSIMVLAAKQSNSRRRNSGDHYIQKSADFSFTLSTEYTEPITLRISWIPKA